MPFCCYNCDIYFVLSTVFLVWLCLKSHTHVSTVQVMLECGVESLVSVVTRELRPVNLLPASMREAHPFLVCHFDFSAFMLMYVSSRGVEIISAFQFVCLLVKREKNAGQIVMSLAEKV